MSYTSTLSELFGSDDFCCAWCSFGSIPDVAEGCFLVTFNVKTNHGTECSLLPVYRVEKVKEGVKYVCEHTAIVK